MHTFRTVIIIYAEDIRQVQPKAEKRHAEMKTYSVASQRFVSNLLLCCCVGCRAIDAVTTKKDSALCNQASDGAEFRMLNHYYSSHVLLCKTPAGEENTHHAHVCSGLWQTTKLAKGFHCINGFKVCLFQHIDLSWIMNYFPPVWLAFDYSHEK